MFKVGDVVIPGEFTGSPGWVEHRMQSFVGKPVKVTRIDLDRGWCELEGTTMLWPMSACTYEGTTKCGEHDPSGKSLNEPGAKADAGKLRPALVFSGFADALEAVALVGTKGAAKYTPNGWLSVPNGFERYSDAQVRHELKRHKGETHDADSGDLHLAHEAWNALAKLQLYINSKKAPIVPQ